jgi:hypothetical protein
VRHEALTSYDSGGRLIDDPHIRQTPSGLAVSAAHISELSFQLLDALNDGLLADLAVFRDFVLNPLFEFPVSAIRELLKSKVGVPIHDGFSQVDLIPRRSDQTALGDRFLC